MTNKAKRVCPIKGGGGQGGTSFEDLGYSPFDAAESYAKDDVVIYNGKLYEFTASHPAGAWTGTDAKETSVAESIAEGKHPYISLERLRQYLYRVTFDTLPQDNGGDNAVAGGCSSFVQDGKLYRNFDFKYDNAAEFIVRTKDFEGMSMITGLNDGQMNDELIAQLPYRMVDGRNNHGIMLSVHLLFNDWQYSGAGLKSIPMTSLPYEILSRVKSMNTIATDLADVLGNLNVTSAMGGYLLQCLVTDGTTTYAVIPPTSDNQSYELVDATSYPKMSNFRYVARAEVSRYDMDIQTRPTGIERFNMMPCELSDLRFTKAYEAADRLSEFIGIDGTTKSSTDEELTAIYNLARAEYLDRERDGKTWQTMHSVVYGDKMESLYIQENWNDDIVASKSGGAIPVVEKTGDVVELEPNKYNKVTVDSLVTFTLGTPTAGIVNEYMIEFTTSAATPTVIFPSSVKWASEFSVVANTTYQVSILNNIAVFAAVKNS